MKSTPYREVKEHVRLTDRSTMLDTVIATESQKVLCLGCVGICRAFLSTALCPCLCVCFRVCAAGERVRMLCKVWGGRADP